MPSNKTPSEWDLQNNPETVRAFSELASVEFTVGALIGDVINVALQVVDGKGNALDQQLAFYAWLSDTAKAAVTGTAPGVGTTIGTNGVIVESLTANASFILLTDTNGQADLDVEDAGADTWYLNVLLPGGSIVSSGAIAIS